jgi:hypothetical protein
MNAKQRIKRADLAKCTWETFFSVADIMKFERDADAAARVFGGEIDWTVVSLTDFIQRSCAEGLTIQQVTELFNECLAGYREVFRSAAATEQIANRIPSPY